MMTMYAGKRLVYLSQYLIIDNIINNEKKGYGATWIHIWSKVIPGCLSVSSQTTPPSPPGASWADQSDTCWYTVVAYTDGVANPVVNAAPSAMNIASPIVFLFIKCTRIRSHIT